MLLNHKFIFIVEGRRQSRLVFQILLGRYGAWVEFEPHIDHALQHLERLRMVDLILLDLSLPAALNGYDVFDLIRAQKKYDSVPIVALTTFGSSITVERTKEKGFNGLITKPIDLNVFPQQIARALEGEEVWPRAAARVVGI